MEVTNYLLSGMILQVAKVSNASSNTFDIPYFFWMLHDGVFVMAYEIYNPC